MSILFFYFISCMPSFSTRRRYHLSYSIPDQIDTRLSTKTGRAPTSKDLYLLSFDSQDDDAFALSVWNNFAPRKCKFFIWLLHKRRLSTNARLNYCNMRPDVRCPFCDEDEDCCHLFVRCRRASSFWTYINCDLTGLSHGDNDIESLWSLDPLQERDSRVRGSILICVQWNIWKCRNAKIFRHEDESNLQISDRCRDDLMLWANRCSKEADRNKILGWSRRFLHVG